MLKGRASKGGCFTVAWPLWPLKANFFHPIFCLITHVLCLKFGNFLLTFWLGPKMAQIGKSVDYIHQMV